MSNELIVVEPEFVETRAIVSHGRPLLTPASIKTEIEQRQLLGQYVKASMVPEVDYGIIPGTKKNTLLKPGAEKLIQLFYCAARYRLEDKSESFETGLFSYRFLCEIVNQEDRIVAEGVGSCSTYESKYRWRNDERKCPACGKEAIIKGKAEYGGGWVCFEKKGGCKAKFNDKDPAIIGQETGKVQNPDIADTINTVLKMAKKRALVDAAISLARCSDLFTQDAEDMDGSSGDYYSAPPPMKSAPQANSRPQNQQQAAPPMKNIAPEEVNRASALPPPSSNNVPFPQAPAHDRPLVAEVVKMFSGKLQWFSEDVRRRVQEIIGREIAPNTPVSDLNDAELRLLIDSGAKKRKAGVA